MFTIYFDWKSIILWTCQWTCWGSCEKSLLQTLLLNDRWPGEMWMSIHSSKLMWVSNVSVPFLRLAIVYFHPRLSRCRLQFRGVWGLTWHGSLADVQNLTIAWSRPLAHVWSDPEILARACVHTLYMLNVTSTTKLYEIQWDPFLC